MGYFYKEMIGMVYIDRCTTYWSCHFTGESGTAYFASIISYTDSKCICTICYITDEGIPKVVYSSKTNDVPSPKLLKYHIEKFLGYGIDAAERSISKI